MQSSHTHTASSTTQTLLRTQHLQSFSRDSLPGPRPPGPPRPWLSTAGRGAKSSSPQAVSLCKLDSQKRLDLECSKARSRMLTDLLNDLIMIKQNGPSIEGADDDVVRQLIDKAFAEWRRRKNRCPARSRTDERPERRKSSKDIMDTISMPRGRKVADGTKECEMNDQDKGKGPALSN
jgi:hypothetical protein